MVQQLLFSVSQGSMLGPLLYILYTAKLSHVITPNGLCFHQYADDSQTYVSTVVDEASLAVQKFMACVTVTVLSYWMSACRLKLSPTKMDVL